MSYTNEQMAEACERAKMGLPQPPYIDGMQGWANVHGALDAAGRTLRAMRGKEQSSAEPSDELTLQRDDLAILVRRLCRHRSDKLAEQAMDYLGRKGLRGSILRVGEIPEASRPLSTADPPPPEDALLARLRSWARAWTLAGEDEDEPGDTNIGALLNEAADRIEADAACHAQLERHLDAVARVVNHGASSRPVYLTVQDRIAAAEARAQGMEADARRYRFLRDEADLSVRDVFGAFCPQLNDGMDAAVDAARSPDGGKERKGWRQSSEYPYEWRYEGQPEPSGKGG